MNDTTDTERAARTRLARAQRGDERAFEALTEPHRRELQLHCYRILGSLQDAEDLLQETLLAAWRGLEQFEGRSSLRTWLYTIATNRCLNALRERQRRPRAALAPRESYGEIPWLQPYPDQLLEGVADAFERDDIDAVVEMLTDDAVVSMPPEPEWFAGRAAIGEFLRARHAVRAGRWRFVPVGANLQPAYAYYLDSDGRFELSGMFVISARPDGIESVTRFAGRRLLSRLDVPRELD